MIKANFKKNMFKKCSVICLPYAVHSMKHSICIERHRADCNCLLIYSVAVCPGLIILRDI